VTYEFFCYLASADTSEICQNGLPKVGKTSRIALWSSLATEKHEFRALLPPCSTLLPTSWNSHHPCFTYTVTITVSPRMPAHSDISCCLIGFRMTAAFSGTPAKHGHLSPKQKWMDLIPSLPFQVSRHPSP
jgi:hypothetical protein